MKTVDDNLYTIPLTSTGYPRRDCKEAMRGYNHNQLAEMLPDLELYKVLRMAFRGGNTHANRYFSGQKTERKTTGSAASTEEVPVRFFKWIP